MPSLVQPAKMGRSRAQASELILKEPCHKPERQRMWGKQGKRHSHAYEDKAGLATGRAAVAAGEGEQPEDEAVIGQRSLTRSLSFPFCQ